MKEQNGGESFEESKEFFDANALIPEEELDLEAEPKPGRKGNKSRVTELRRRIEERLDSKRVDLEFDYDLLDDLDDSPDSPDSLQ